MVGPIMNLITKTHYYMKRMEVIPKMLNNYSRESKRETKIYSTSRFVGAANSLQVIKKHIFMEALWLAWWREIQPTKLPFY